METPLTNNIAPGKEPRDLRQYENVGGYAAVRKALRMAPAEVMAMVKESNLRGRGGAGFRRVQTRRGRPERARPLLGFEPVLSRGARADAGRRDEVTAHWAAAAASPVCTRQRRS